MAVEGALDRRELPDAQTRRIRWSESGALSPNREYFRIEGSGFAFDICAAPFGTGFFFSWWLTRKRAEFIGAFLLLFLFASWSVSRALAPIVSGLFQGVTLTFDPMMLAVRFLLLNPITIAVLSVLFAMVIVNVISRGKWSWPEEALLAVPVLGWVYEHIFAPVTFYRLDTAAMFRATVHAAVLEVIDDLTTQRGLRALAPEERKPLFDRLAA
jgi:hypothetical protein